MITITNPIVAVIHLAIDPPPVLRQVILRGDKRKGDLIRLGETPGDEANGWIRLSDIEVITILGDAVERDGKWLCVPQKEAADGVA